MKPLKRIALALCVILFPCFAWIISKSVAHSVESNNKNQVKADSGIYFRTGPYRIKR